MNCLTYILLYSIVLASSRIYAANFYAGEEVDLGSYSTQAVVGKKIPNNLQNAEVDVEVSTNARTLVENLRSKFSSGAPPIPRLDPYKSKSFSAAKLDGNNDLPLTGNINIKQVILTGGKNFVLKQIDIRNSDKNTEVDLKVILPELKGNVLFEAQLRLAGIYPVNVEGEMKVSLKGVLIGVKVWAEENEGAKHIYNLQGLLANFDADNIKIQIVKSNLSKFLANMADSYIPLGPNTTFRSTILNLVRDYVAKQVFKQVKHILSKITVGEIEAFLLTKER